MGFKLSVLYLVVCGSMACYYPYMIIYYQYRGLNYSQIGFLFAVNSLVAVISQPFWGIVTDKYLNKRKSFLLVLAFSSIFVIGFMFVKSYVAILLWVITFMVFQSPTLSINDAFCYEVIDSHKSLQYGKLRLMGSIGYAVVALLMAYIIKWTSINSSFLAFALLGLLGILVLRGINIKGKSSKSAIDLSDIVSIIRNKRFIILVVSALLVSASMSANSNYLGTLIQKTGGDVSNIGTLWFVIAMSELPAFFFGGRILKKFGVINVYYISLIFYISRFFLDSICVNYQAVIAIQLFQAVTYPLYIMSTLQCINEIVPVKARTTAITVFAALTAGVGGFMGNISGGMVIGDFSVFLLFRIMAGLCILSLLIGLILKKNTKVADL
jgi:MFS transporter, PPP family, 3-phenylpropionic acid transporter